MVSSGNTFSGRRVFVSYSKQGGGLKIERKNWNIGDRQQRGATVWT